MTFELVFQLKREKAIHSSRIFSLNNNVPHQLDSIIILHDPILLYQNLYVFKNTFVAFYFFLKNYRHIMIQISAHVQCNLATSTCHRTLVQIIP